MSTSAPEAPAPTGDAPQEPATPATSTAPEAPPAPPEAPPQGQPEPPAEQPLESVADLGDGPDGDPVEGESQLDRLKRIARREAKEKRNLERTLSGERDQAVTRAEAAEAALAEAQTAAAELSTVKETLAQKELELLRYSVGSTKGLTLDQSARLKGSNREEIEADLDRYVSETALPRVTPKVETHEDRRQFVERMNRNRY